MGEPAPPDPRHLLSPVAISLVIAGISQGHPPFQGSALKGRHRFRGGGNIIRSTSRDRNMKEYDDTPEPKSESEQMFEHVSDAVDTLNRQLQQQLDQMNERLEQLAVRIANLETQRTPQDENDDAEWY